MQPSPPSRKGRLARVLRRLRAGRAGSFRIADLPAIPIPAAAVQVLAGPAEFRSVLFDRIARARRRILITALYLQDDATGHRLMDALYAARRANPALDILVLVDKHRAQRSLLGKARSFGNVAMYRDYARRFGGGVKILGVSVRGRELFGVLHLKGFVVDDTVIYSGASLNDVYLAGKGRYRLDRYHVFESAPLADCFADFVHATLLDSPAVSPLYLPGGTTTRRESAAIRALRRDLWSAHYVFDSHPRASGEVAVTPLVGLGAGNPLNETILALMASAKKRVVLYTPYFNLPAPIRRSVARLLAQGREVSVVVGDKTANDFYIPPGEPFKTSGLLPYLYETNLRRFARRHQRYIDEGRLNLFLWRDGDNSFHLKGLWVDDRVALLTGNNLNPRSWTLDLENGLVVRDPNGLLVPKHTREHAAVMRHAHRLAAYHDLDAPGSYPPIVRRALTYLDRGRVDRLLNRVL